MLSSELQKTPESIFLRTYSQKREFIWGMTGVFPVPGWRVFLSLDKFVNASGKVANPQDTHGIITPGLTDPVEISAGILEQSM